MSRALQVYTVLRTLKGLGINIIWTRQKTAPFCYLQETNEIVLRKDFFESGVCRSLNFDMFCHAIFHEIAHAILWQWKAVPPAGPTVNIPEEIWCDKFASDMCKKLGVKNHKRFEGYVQEYGDD